MITGPRLTPAPAAAALIVTADGRYLLQHRDELPGIFFPGFWGCFGGGMEAGETPADALRRELVEELGWSPAELRHFATLGLDFSFSGHGLLPRHFFVAPLEPGETAGMRLGEGQDFALVPAQEILSMPRVVPYDATVIWQHASRARF